jgi:probable F420-dependent oxidoreductase
MAWRDEADLVRAVESLGFGSIWIGEGAKGQREVFAHAAALLSTTERLIVGTGVARARSRLPSAMQGAADMLSDFSDGRFVLGIGSGASPMAGESTDEGRFAWGVDRLRSYVTEMGAHPPDPFVAVRAPVLIGAVGPRMLEFAREASDGAHTFSMPPEHTAWARSVLGADKCLVVEQAVICDDEFDQPAELSVQLAAGRLRAASYDRAYARVCPDLPTDEPGRSAALADLLYVWGDADRIVDRLERHRSAGADVVLIHVIARSARGMRRLLTRVSESAGLSHGGSVHDG